MTPVTLASDAPLTGFSDCHRGIVCGLRAFASLPELVAAASRARTVASATLQLFENSVLPHHADEESGLFPAVLRVAGAGEELARVQALIARLTAEHRSVEALWKTLKPAVRRAARGGAADLDPDAVAALVQPVQLVQELERRLQQFADQTGELSPPAPAQTPDADAAH